MSDHKLIVEPSEDWTLAERWVHYKKAENEAKKKLKEIAEDALVQVDHNGGYLQGRSGKAQKIDKTNRKPKESLKTFLADEGILEMCTKDDIDLKKVDELIEAGIIDPEEAEKHIDTNMKPYLKLGK